MVFVKATLFASIYFVCIYIQVSAEHSRSIGKLFLYDFMLVDFQKKLLLTLSAICAQIMITDQRFIFVQHIHVCFVLTNNFNAWKLMFQMTLIKQLEMDWIWT